MILIIVCQFDNQLFMKLIDTKTFGNGRFLSRSGQGLIIMTLNRIPVSAIISRRLPGNIFKDS